MKLPAIKLDTAPRKPSVLARHVVEAMVCVTCPDCGVESEVALTEFLPIMRRSMTRGERVNARCECGTRMEIAVNNDYGVKQ